MRNAECNNAGSIKALVEQFLSGVLHDSFKLFVLTYPVVNCLPGYAEQTGGLREVPARFGKLTELLLGGCLRHVGERCKHISELPISASVEEPVS